jgi:RNA polymerase sigma-70 factor (ECF subfamily)
MPPLAALPWEGAHVTAALLDAAGALGARYAERLAAARQQYPALQAEAEPFARHVATALESAAPELVLALGELHFGDLYLAYCCSTGQPQALALFEAHHVRSLRTFIAEFDRSPAQLDELKQVLRERLLLAAGGAPPRIARYAGRGTLAAWVQVAAQRLALSALRRPRPELPATDLLLDCVASDDDQDLEVVQLRLQHAAPFREALSATLAELESRERLLLRMHLVEGISLTRIAASYHVSQSTASRWFAQIRDKVREGAKRRLHELLGLNSSEFHSVARLLDGQLDLSLSSVLRSAATTPSAGAEPS